MRQGALKTNYVFVDYENVQPRNLELLDGTAVRTFVFLGASQTKIPVKFAKALQQIGAGAE
jgi:hypothetical protein